MKIIPDQTWCKYWKLTVLKKFKKVNRYYYRCICECWNIKDISNSHLRNWHTKSCWCLKKESSKKHWLRSHKLYNVFNAIKSRCFNKNTKMFKHYWWRWIKCEWISFEEFYNDMWESYQEWLTIDRIDVNWNYCKNNCRFVSMKEQANNKRNTVYYKWEPLTIVCDRLWLNKSTISSRIYIYWWSIDEAVEWEIKRYYINNNK